jgi:hypothetical protein
MNFFLKWKQIYVNAVVVIYVNKTT